MRRDLFAAAAFAQAGEVDAALELAGRRTVMLVAGESGVEPGALECALRLCARLRAGLELMFPAAPGATPGTTPSVDAACAAARRAGIAAVARPTGAASVDAVHARTRSGPPVLCVVVDRTLERLRGWERLDCPLVTAAAPGG